MQTEHPDNASIRAKLLLVLEGDGMRIRERVAKGAKRNGELDNGWRECKVGVVIRCQRSRRSHLQTDRQSHEGGEQTLDAARCGIHRRAHL
ncbi:MAG TPA: hypothetical protein VGP72_21235 [Planctomycetota bacterium]